MIRGRAEPLVDLLNGLGEIKILLALETIEHRSFPAGSALTWTTPVPARVYREACRAANSLVCGVWGAMEQKTGLSVIIGGALASQRS